MNKIKCKVGLVHTANLHHNNKNSHNKLTIYPNNNQDGFDINEDDKRHSHNKHTIYSNDKDA